MEFTPIQGPQSTLFALFDAATKSGITYPTIHFRVVSGRADLSDIFIVGLGVYNEITFDAIGNYICWYPSHNKAITFPKTEPVYPITYNPPVF